MDELLCNDAGYAEVLEGVKREVSQARARSVLAVNRELICMYWRIGRMVDERSEWGSRFVESLSHDIRVAYPGIKGFSVRNLKYMRKFYREYDYEFVQQLVAQIPWGHITHLLDKVPDRAIRDWYVHKTIEHGWSRAVLMHQISIRLYERQVSAGKTTNFNRTLPPAESELVERAFKDPYIFDFVTAEQGAAEKDVEDEMVRNVTSLLLELGTGFGFMGRRYPRLQAKDMRGVPTRSATRGHLVMRRKKTSSRPQPSTSTSKLPMPLLMTRSASKNARLNSSVLAESTVVGVATPLESTRATSAMPTCSASSSVTSLMAGPPRTP